MGTCTKKYAFAALFAALFAVLSMSCEPDSSTTAIQTGVSSAITPLSVTGFTPTATSDPNGQYSLITDLTSLKFSQDYAETGNASIDLTKPVYKREDASGTAWYLWASVDPSRYVLSREKVEDGWFFEDASPASPNPRNVQNWKQSSASAAAIAADGTQARDESATRIVFKAVESVSIAPQSGNSDSVVTGNSTALEASVTPSDADNPAVEWRSSDTTIATVSATGVVTGVAAGTTDITAVSKDDSSKISTPLPITVVDQATISGQPTAAYDATTKKLSISVTFSGPVTVSGTPIYLVTVAKSINFRPVGKTLAYVRGSGTATLVFEYTKETGVYGTVSYAANPIDLGGGAITVGTTTQNATLTGITEKTNAATIAADISAIGLEDGTIPDASLDASSFNNSDTLPGKGRLNGSLAWVPQTTSGQWWQVNMGSERDVVQFATQGRGSNIQQWNKTYKLKYSTDGQNWTDYKNGQVLTGNTDATTIVTVDLTPFRAQYVRFLIESWNIHPSGRFEVYEAK